MTEEQILEWLDKNNRGFTQKDFELFKKFYEEATKELQEEQDYAKNNCLFSDCDRVVRLKSQIAELEAQIEKMKNCKNCANYMISGKCPSFFRTGWCKNWELAD